jgi:hypothetical protein
MKHATLFFIACLFSCTLVAGDWQLISRFSINNSAWENIPDTICITEGTAVNLKLTIMNGSGGPPLTCFSVLNPSLVSSTNTSGEYTFTQSGEYKIFFNCPTPLVERIFYIQVCSNVQTMPASINEASSAAGVTAYPNPFQDQLNIRLSGNSNDLRIAIFSLDGRLAMEKQYAGISGCAIETFALPAGVYIVEVRNEGKISRQKILKSGL